MRRCLSKRKESFSEGTSQSISIQENLIHRQEVQIQDANIVGQQTIICLEWISTKSCMRIINKQLKRYVLHLFGKV